MKRGMEICAFLYLTASIVVLFFPLLGGGSLFFRDIQLLFVPMKHFLAKCWSEGQLPLWNPGLFCGAPFLSDIQTGVFYPLSIVFYLLPIRYSFSVFVISHFILAACFVFGLTRHWDCSRPAACLAALCFTLGGYLVSTANVVNNLQSAIWLPVVFLCFEKALLRHALFYRLLGAVFLAIQFLGGEPQLLVFTVLLLFVYNLVVNRQTGWLHHLSKTGIVLASVGVVSIALVMVQLYPTWEMFRNSIRASGFSFQEATKFSLNPWALSQLLAPPVFDIYNSGNKHLSWLLSNYFGLIPLIFVITAVVYARTKRVKFWAGCLVAGLILAFGKYTPLYLFLHKTIPSFDAFRFPEKFMFFFAYAMAFLAAFGLDFLLERKRHPSNIGVTFPALIAILFLVTLMIKFALPGSKGNNIAHTLSSPLFICIAGLSIFLFLKKSLSKSTFCALIVVVATVDLLVAHIPLNSVVSNTFYEKPNLVHSIGKVQRSGRIFVQTYSYADLHGRELPPFAVQHLWHDNLWPNTGTLYNMSYVNGLGGTETQYQWLITELLENLNLRKRIRFLEVTNTRYLVAMESEKIEEEMRSGRLGKIHKGLYKLPNALPRAYMVPQVKMVPDQAKAIEEILKDGFDPLQSVVLEKMSQVSPVDGQGGKVLDLRYEGPNRIEVTAESLGGYLVLLDSFYPGWRVLVNGREQGLFRANGLFKAVFLEPGRHQIVFSYEPRYFVWGLLTSLISLCLVIVGLWVSRPKHPILDASCRKAKASESKDCGAARSDPQ